MAVGALCTEYTQRALKLPLKLAGGKRWLMFHLGPCWEQYSHRRLVEPFCGGLAVGI